MAACNYMPNRMKQLGGRGGYSKAFLLVVLARRASTLVRRVRIGDAADACVEVEEANAVAVRLYEGVIGC